MTGLHHAIRLLLCAALLGLAPLNAPAQENAGDVPSRLEAPRPLEPRGLENIIAFTRLLGYVRHFHPSDEAAATNWEQFAVTGMRQVESAANAGALADTLKALFLPIAPTLRIYPTSTTLPMLPMLPLGMQPTRVLAWTHHGFGTGSPRSIYVSDRLTIFVDPKTVTTSVPPDRLYTADLGGGVSATIPIAVYADSSRTMPPGAPIKSPVETLSARDRATRLADVALAWNVFQHFYPYFDVVQTDWPGALRDALARAATDENEEAFLVTLQRLVAALHDGHGRALLAGRNRSLPPVTLTFAGDRIVIRTIIGNDTSGLKRGDVIEAIDGAPTANVVAALEQTISAATPYWMRARVLEDILQGPPGSEVRLEVTHPDGAKQTITARRSVSADDYFETAIQDADRPEKIAEVAPGVMYVDVDRINDADVKAALPKLRDAKGIVVDFRGYPSNFREMMPFLSNMSRETLTSPQWHVPIVTRPDREAVTYDSSAWPPQEHANPGFKAMVAFLTFGGSISYAESSMQVAAFHKLGEIIGEPTAGTNGNINPFRLPGGYVLIYTGMKVLKQDGSQYHGIGVKPTIPLSRTVRGVAEGRDEVLQKAIEVVSRP